jgi:hypothetical protein
VLLFLEGGANMGYVVLLIVIFALVFGGIRGVVIGVTGFSENDAGEITIDNNCVKR